MKSLSAFPFNSIFNWLPRLLFSLFFPPFLASSIFLYFSYELFQSFHELNIVFAVNDLHVSFPPKHFGQQTGAAERDQWHKQNISREKGVVSEILADTYLLYIADIAVCRHICVIGQGNCGNAIYEVSLSSGRTPCLCRLTAKNVVYIKSWFPPPSKFLFASLATFFAVKFPLIKIFHASAIKMRPFPKSAHHSRRQRPNGKSLANSRFFRQLTRPLHLKLNQVDDSVQRILFKTLPQKLRARKKIVVISGAGISVNAGDTWICLRDIVD